MKYILFLLLWLPFSAPAQSIIEKANKCYDEKNWQCAINFYEESMANKDYQEKDYALIQFRIGYGYYSIKKYPEAIAAFQLAVGRKPDYGAAHWNMGYCNYMLGNYNLAVESYIRAEVCYTDNKSLRSILYWKSKSLYKLKKYTEALTAIQKAISQDSLHDDSYALAGDISFNNYQYRAALDYYTKCIALAPSDLSNSSLASRYFMRGKTYFRLVKYDSALTEYQHVLKVYPEHKTADWEIAAVYYNKKEWPDAISSYSKAIKLHKNDTLSLRDLYYYRGICYSNMKDYSKAFSDFDLSLKMDPAYLSAYEKKADLYYAQQKIKDAENLYSKLLELSKYEYDKAWYHIKRARCRLVLRDTLKAVNDLDNAAYYDEYGDYPEIDVEYGNIYFGQKKYRDAAAKYNLGLAIYSWYESNEHTASLFLRKGISNLVSGNFEHARTALEKSIFYNASLADAHRYMGELHFAQKNYSLAQKSFTKCIEFYKHSKDSLARAHGYRAQTFYYQKNYQQAISDYEQADKLTPGNVDYVVAIGQLAFELKDYQKVISSFTRAIPMLKPSQVKELAFLYYGRGRAYHGLKNKDKALADIKKAIELVPEFHEAKTWFTTVSNATY